MPKSLKAEFLKKLRLMNISSRSLFPGIDGLGRSMDEIAGIYSRDWVRSDEWIRAIAAGGELGSTGKPPVTEPRR